MIELSRHQIAELRGCTPSTVSRAHLPKTPGGNYNLQDPDVWAYVISPAVELAIHNAKANEPAPSGLEDAKMQQLEEEKLRREIVWKEKQSRKLDREHELAVKNLILRSDASLAIGTIFSGIKTNLLPVGSRVARGDTKLRKRIDEEIKRGLEKTKKNAQDEIKKIIKLEIDA